MKSGYSSESFPDEEEKTIENYAKELDEKNGNNKIIKLIQRAKREGMHLLEQLGIKGLSGEKNKFNGSVWIFIMKSRYGIGEKSFDKKNKDKIIKVNLDFENEKNNGND